MVLEMVLDNQVNPDSLVNQVMVVDPAREAVTVTAVEPAGEAVMVTAVETVTEAAVLAVHQTLPHVTYVGLNSKNYPVDHGHQLVNRK